MADGLKFYQQNGNGDNAVKMHGYILVAEQSLVVGKLHTSLTESTDPLYRTTRLESRRFPLHAPLASTQLTSRWALS